MSATLQERPAKTLDYVRGLAMIGVIYAHAMNLFIDRPDGLFVSAAFTQGQAIASFVMALFFVASGAASRNIAASTLRKAMRTSLQLLILVFLLHLAGLVLTYGLLHLQPDPWDRQFLEDAALDTLLGAPSIGTLWFLLTLAVVRLAFFLIVARAPRWAFWPTVAAGVGLSLISSSLPEAFAMRSWAAALVFVLLGYRFADLILKVPAWTILPAAVAVAALSPLNRGCTLSFPASCPNTADGVFFVDFLEALIGFAPLFYVTALAGCVGAFGLARWLARREAPLVGVIGRNSLNILIVHGIILQASGPYLRETPLSAPDLAYYPLLLIGLIVFNLAAAQLAEPLLRRIRLKAGVLADGALTRAWSKAPRSAAVRNARYPASFSSSSSEMS